MTDYNPYTFPKFTQNLARKKVCVDNIIRYIWFTLVSFNFFHFNICECTILVFGSLGPRGRDITQFSYSITILILTFSRPSNSRWYIFWYFLSILGTIYAHFKPVFKIVFLTHIFRNCIITRMIPIIYHKINKYLEKAALDKCLYDGCPVCIRCTCIISDW